MNQSVGVTALVLAGGLGTRLREVTGDRYPKPMAPIPYGQTVYPFLEFVLAQLRRQGVLEIVLCVGHLGDRISCHFGDGSRFGMRISYDDAGSADTGLRVLRALRHIESDVFLLTCGDTFSLVAVDDFLREFDRHRQWLIQLAVVGTTESYQPNLALDDSGRVTGYDPDGHAAGLVGLETGTMAVRTEAFDGFAPDRNFSLTADVYPKLIQREALGGVMVDTNFFDIGTPAGYRGFCDFVAEGGARPVSEEP